MSVEEAAITAAREYARANGYGPDDRTAGGLLLAGMAIMAGCSAPVRESMRRSYLAQLPEAREPIEAWTAFLEQARQDRAEGG